jgi:hypothetical protein
MFSKVKIKKDTGSSTYLPNKETFFTWLYGARFLLLLFAYFTVEFKNNYLRVFYSIYFIIFVCFLSRFRVSFLINRNILWVKTLMSIKIFRSFGIIYHIL